MASMDGFEEEKFLINDTPAAQHVLDINIKTEPTENPLLAPLNGPKYNSSLFTPNPNSRKKAKFTKEGSAKLLEIIAQYVDIIENKTPGSVSLDERVMTWETVTNKYNALNIGTKVTVGQLKNRYQMIKKSVKKRQGGNLERLDWSLPRPPSPKFEPTEMLAESSYLPPIDHPASPGQASPVAPVPDVPPPLPRSHKRPRPRGYMPISPREVSWCGVGQESVKKRQGGNLERLDWSLPRPPSPKFEPTEMLAESSMLDSTENSIEEDPAEDLVEAIIETNENSINGNSEPFCERDFPEPDQKKNHFQARQLEMLEAEHEIRMRIYNQLLKNAEMQKCSCSCGLGPLIPH